MADSEMIDARRQFLLLPDYVAPRNLTEQKVAEIWQRGLGMDRIGMDDRFDNLGGTSLLAAMIFAEIEKAFAIKIPMAVLIDAPTIGLLAPKIQGFVQLKS